MKRQSIGKEKRRNYLQISTDLSLLFKPTRRWDFQTYSADLDIYSTAHEMVELMYEKKGFGLAANQVGLPYSFFCMRGDPESFFFINPRIVNLSGNVIDDLEGCLSYPGLAIKKKRWNEVRLRFEALDKQTHTRVFQGVSARVIQHEMDHLEGNAWWEGISKLKFDIAKRKAKARGWNYDHVTFK